MTVNDRPDYRPGSLGESVLLSSLASRIGIHDVFQDEQAASPRLQAATATARVMFISVSSRIIGPEPFVRASY
jgi:hypothetical protein